MANLILVPQDYATIQEAINAAANYDTIRVAPGTYTANITVNKSIQLLGAQAGIDARTRVGADESIIALSGTRPFQITVDHVVIDGFTIQGNTLGHGISIGPVSGFWIFNNIIQNNMIGLFTDLNSGTPISQIRQNVFRDNIDPITNGGTGIFSHTVNLYIDNNLFTGQREFASINITSGSANVFVTNNDIIDDTSIAMVEATNVKIANNRLIGTQGTAIFIGGDNDAIEIEGNTVTGGISNGISVNTIFKPGFPNSNIRMKDNAIFGNQLAGLNVNAGAYNTTAPNRMLDATNDWWGSASGPNYNGGGPGTGEEINDPDLVVIFEPFLTENPLSASPIVTPIQRLVSNDSSVYIAASRNTAILEAIAGVGVLATQVPQNLRWPNLKKFVNDNSAFGVTDNPVYLWASTISGGQSLGFAIASNEFTVVATSQLVITLTAFCDNAMEPRIDLLDTTTNNLVSLPPLGTMLVDGSMNPATVELPPYNWQNIRYYSIASNLILAGTYKVIVSFQAINYNSDPGQVNPAGLSFVTDIYQAT